MNLHSKLLILIALLILLIVSVENFLSNSIEKFATLLFRK